MGEVHDIASSAVKASSKAAGVIIDDAAVTPKYVTGLSPARELPIIARIARGSLVNKLLIVLPALLLLDAFMPAAIIPILMVGGAYLCYEGAEKVFHALGFGGGHGHAEETEGSGEDARARSAIRTDLILSAEIMTLSLSVIEAEGLVARGVILGVTGVIITIAVYGAVGILVKLDDLGLHMARRRNQAVSRFGTGLVRSMPAVFTVITVIGTAAMLWVGGNILVHGTHTLGWHAPHDAVRAFAAPFGGGIPGWLATACADGVIGAAVGGVVLIVTKAVRRIFVRVRTHAS